MRAPLAPVADMGQIVLLVITGALPSFQAPRNPSPGMNISLLAAAVFNPQIVRALR